MHFPLFSIMQCALPTTTMSIYFDLEQKNEIIYPYLIQFYIHTSFLNTINDTRMDFRSPMFNKQVTHHLLAKNLDRSFSSSTVSFFFILYLPIPYISSCALLIFSQWLCRYMYGHIYIKGKRLLSQRNQHHFYGIKRQVHSITFYKQQSLLGCKDHQIGTSFCTVTYCWQEPSNFLNFC